MSDATRSTRKFLSLGPDGWVVPPRGTSYRYHVYVNGLDGRFSATVATVPGVTATGMSVDEVLATVTASLTKLLRESKAGGPPMPHGEVEQPPASVTRGVFIDLNVD
jgi:predicted RNase H-like HicB family nuclease